MDFPDVPVRLSGGTLGGGGGCLGSGLGAQASVTSFPTTLEPWQVLQLFVVGDFWTCSCHARGAPSGGKMEGAWSASEWLAEHACNAQCCLVKLSAPARRLEVMAIATLL